MPGGSAAPTVAPGQQNVGTPPTAPMAPFTRASIEHSEPAGVRSSFALIATPQDVGPSNIVAYGFLAYLGISVSATGGTGSAALYKADAPFSAIAQLVLQDINGTPLVQLSGYELFIAANCFGGYDFDAWPQQGASYVAPTTAGNFAFQLRVPIQLRQRDALGCLPNMNAASSYQLKYTVAQLSDIYSTNPTGIPNIAVNVELYAWALPGPQNAQGQPNAQVPPALGTTQYWTRQSGIAIAAGYNTITLSRVGNLIRNLIFIGRDSSGVRTDASLLDSFQFLWDARIINDETLAFRREAMYRRFGLPPTATALTGVMCLDYTHSFTGHPGDGDLPDLWLPTASSSRLNYQGTAAGAGTLTVVTNDVIPQGDIFGG